MKLSKIQWRYRVYERHQEYPKAILVTENQDIARAVCIALNAFPGSIRQFEYQDVRNTANRHAMIGDTTERF